MIATREAPQIGDRNQYARTDSAGHPGKVLNTPLAALARLQLARAFVLTGDSTKAIASYRDFLALWKGADRDAPSLVKASGELAHLQTPARQQQ